MVPRRCEKSQGGPFFHHTGPPKIAVAHLLIGPADCTERGMLRPLLRVGVGRFLPSAGGSSAAGLKPCGEPTCKIKSQLVSLVHRCPCGRPMHAFCGRSIGAESHGQQRECSDCQQKKYGDLLYTRNVAAHLLDM